MRLGTLVELMGLFGIVGALIQPQRRKRSFAGIAATGATVAYLVYLVLLFFVTGVIEPTPFSTRMWLSAVVIASFAVALGAAMAASTRYE